VRDQGEHLKTEAELDRLLAAPAVDAGPLPVELRQTLARRRTARAANAAGIALCVVAGFGAWMVSVSSAPEREAAPLIAQGSAEGASDIGALVDELMAGGGRSIGLAGRIPEPRRGGSSDLRITVGSSNDLESVARALGIDLGG